MKTKLLLSLLGLVTISSFGQGVIQLDNYNTYGPYVTYGFASDGPVGAGLSSAYTMGLYYWNALGDFTGSTFYDRTGTALPGLLGNYFPATGPGSTAQFQTSAFGQAGAALAGAAWNVPIVPSGTGGATITLMVVAYEGANYASAVYRAHSAPFTLVTSDASSPFPVQTGTAMPAFSVFSSVIPDPPTPEPTVYALASLSCVVWFFLRRSGS